MSAQGRCCTFMKFVMPVTLPPVRLKLPTSPTLMGSSPITKTTGIVLVAAFAANAAGNVCVAMTLGLRSIRSAARAGSRSTWPFARRDSKRQVAAVREAPFVQTLAKRRFERRERFGPSADKSSDHRHRWLLRACRERPRCRAAEQRDELAAVHSITSSARSCIDGGTFKPSVLAVFRLMTNSNLVG